MFSKNLLFYFILACWVDFNWKYKSNAIRVRPAKYHLTNDQLKSRDFFENSTLIDLHRNWFISMDKNAFYGYTQLTDLILSNVFLKDLSVYILVHLRILNY